MNKDKIIDFIYPNVCGFCGNKINERYTCRKCLNIIKYYKEVAILRTTRPFYYDKLICAFDYNGLLKEKMLYFKFNDKRYFCKSFAEVLWLKLGKYNITAELIIPVPIHKKRFFERGYNQSEYIARYMSLLSGIPLENGCLIKSKLNVMQSKLNFSDRKINVEGVYQVENIDRIRGKTVILVDDIYTTGSTINECSKVLKGAGASEIVAMTVLYRQRKDI